MTNCQRYLWNSCRKNRRSLEEGFNTCGIAQTPIAVNTKLSRQVHEIAQNILKVDRTEKSISRIWTVLQWTVKNVCLTLLYVSETSLNAIATRIAKFQRQSKHFYMITEQYVAWWLMVKLIEQHQGGWEIGKKEKKTNGHATTDISDMPAVSVTILPPWVAANNKVLLFLNQRVYLQ